MAFVQVINDGKDRTAVATTPSAGGYNASESDSEDTARRSPWWRGGYDSDEKKLLLKLDFFIL